MTEIKIRLTGWKAITFIVAAIILTAAYIHWVEVSVQRAQGLFRTALVNDCSRRAFSNSSVTKDNLSRSNELVAAIGACKNIRIASISANGGVILPVMARVELDAAGFIPDNERVRYLYTIGTRIFPFTLYVLITDNWFVEPIAMYSDSGARYFYYLRF